ncbi:MAG TPA: sulfonate ABC transporter permease, partial [Massilia sp.]|nr:sulfonate ABC transporter permease [Massilia sp.]
MSTSIGRNKQRNWREIGVGMVVPVLAIAIWQAVASMGWVNPQVLPSPLAVWERWVA